MTRRVALIIATASYERVFSAISLASVLQSMGASVSILFTYGGVLRVSKKTIDEVMSDTAELRDKIREAVARGIMTKISEALKVFKQLGGKVYACPVAMSLHGLERSDLVDEVDGVIGLAEFMREHLDAEIIHV